LWPSKIHAEEAGVRIQEPGDRMAACAICFVHPESAPKAAVPEGLYDRSLARGAWESVRPDLSRREQYEPGNGLCAPKIKGAC
jgi:hypothetical protein